MMIKESNQLIRYKHMHIDLVSKNKSEKLVNKREEIKCSNIIKLYKK